MGLVKTSDNATDYYLPVIIKTKKGFIKRNLYYNCEFELFKACKQLRKIKCNIIPLNPIVFDSEVYI